MNTAIPPLQLFAVYCLCAVITKTCLHNFDPFKPHFYTVKLGFTGVYIIFLISAQKYRLWVLARTASSRRFSRVSTLYVLSWNMKSTRIFYLKIFNFFVVKFSVYLNRHVFVMYVLSLFLHISPYSDTSIRMCITIVASHGYFHLCFCKQ